MSTQNVMNTRDYTELYAQYNWFSSVYPPVIQQISDDFFLPGFQFILIGISKNINTLMDKDAYFVTKVRIDKQHDMFFRSSEKPDMRSRTRSLRLSGLQRMTRSGRNQSVNR